MRVLLGSGAGGGPKRELRRLLCVSRDNGCPSHKA